MPGQNEFNESDIPCSYRFKNGISHILQTCMYTYETHLWWQCNLCGLINKMSRESTSAQILKITLQPCGLKPKTSKQHLAKIGMLQSLPHVFDRKAINRNEGSITTAKPTHTVACRRFTKLVLAAWHNMSTLQETKTDLYSTHACVPNRHVPIFAQIYARTSWKKSQAQVKLMLDESQLSMTIMCYVAVHHCFTIQILKCVKKPLAWI